jgi:hypothetical protein
MTLAVVGRQVPRVEDVVERLDGRDRLLLRDAPELRELRGRLVGGIAREPEVVVDGDRGVVGRPRATAGSRRRPC